ncbi:MAG: hypothetical protein AAGF58_11000 [Pseudomonadota bacterium]
MDLFRYISPDGSDILSEANMLDLQHSAIGKPAQSRVCFALDVTLIDFIRPRSVFGGRDVIGYSDGLREHHEDGVIGQSDNPIGRYATAMEGGETCVTSADAVSGIDHEEGRHGRAALWCQAAI